MNKKETKDNLLLKNLLFCISASAYILLSVPASPRGLVAGAAIAAVVYLITRFTKSIPKIFSGKRNRPCLVTAIALSLILGLRFEKVWRYSQQVTALASRVGLSIAWILYPVGILLGALAIYFCYVVVYLLVHLPKKSLAEAGTPKIGKRNLIPSKSFLFGMIAVLLIQFVVLMYWGVRKEGYHVDEVYTFELSNYRYTNYGDAPDAYNTWITGDDLATVVEPDGTELLNVTVPYWNSETDNHPFVYYTLVHLFSSLFTLFHFGVQKWAALIPNIVSCLATSFVLGLLTYALTKSTWASLLASLFWSLSVGGISTGVFLRMYAMLTFWCVLFTYLHVLFYQDMRENCVDQRLGMAMLLCTTAGVLTQYYFLIFAFIFCAISFAVLCFRREWKLLKAYTLLEFNGVFLAEVLFPRMLFRLLFGDRGQEALSNAASANLNEKLRQILNVINEELFSGYGVWVASLCLGLLLLGVIVGLIRKENNRQGRILLQVMAAVSLFVLVVAKLAPYMIDRYFMCVFPLLLMICVCSVYGGVKTILPRNSFGKFVSVAAVAALVIIVTATGMMTQPVRYVYSNQAERREQLAKYGEIPVVLINADHYDDSALNWLFELKEYPDVFLCSHENISVIRKAVETKDISEGFLLYVHMFDDPEAALEEACSAIDTCSAELVTDRGGCPVYCITTRVTGG